MLFVYIPNTALLLVPWNFWNLKIDFVLSLIWRKCKINFQAWNFRWYIIICHRLIINLSYFSFSQHSSHCMLPPCVPRHKKNRIVFFINLEMQMNVYFQMVSIVIQVRSFGSPFLRLWSSVWTSVLLVLAFLKLLFYYSISSSFEIIVLL